MNTTDEIMALVSTYADAASEAVYEDLQLTSARRALITAIDQLVEQAKWANHIPKLLSEADADADLAGTPRPGAEQWVAFVMHEVQVAASMWALVGSRFDDGTCLDDFERQKTELRAILYTPPQASQPEARAGAEPVAYLYHDATTPQDAHPWLHSTMLVLAADRRQGLRGETPLYTAPPQASQPEARPGAEPVAAQQRFRHPQKTMPDWSPWQLCKPATRPAWEVDSEGYEVEYRALYTTPQASQPVARPGACDPAPDERVEFEAWAIGILCDNPTWKESAPYELAWQSWQARAAIAAPKGKP